MCALGRRSIVHFSHSSARRQVPTRCSTASSFRRLAPTTTRTRILYFTASSWCRLEEHGASWHPSSLSFSLLGLSTSHSSIAVFRGFSHTTATPDRAQRTVTQPPQAQSSIAAKPKHALQRTRSAVTLAASCRRLSPAMQPARQLDGKLHEDNACTVTAMKHCGSHSSMPQPHDSPSLPAPSWLPLPR